ncbi:MAG TPA: N-acetyl-gamma-glutamyl-phosphate reductase [Saprospiraceae bacterium]|nr:N-acetyl-gamma-glutamyl-phosphate reductase [Saprospiraceae bacterium]
MKISVGIAGAAGYTAGELIRLLIHHPMAELVALQSKSQAGKKITDVHRDLIGETDLIFTEKISQKTDVLFLCFAHGETDNYLSENSFSKQTKIIDLSRDFRWKESQRLEHEFVYGLPELQREKISNAKAIANPGCFATAIQLAVLPLSYTQNLTDDLHISAITGSTGAGQAPSATTHFSWRQSNFSVYKAFEHEHLFEIKKTIEYTQKNFNSDLHFIPSRGNFTRGIHASIYTQCEMELDSIKSIYANFYKEHPFVVISESEIDLKQVVNTNKCILNISKHGKMIYIQSIIDNLLKGASGQAIQNMNLMFGLNETLGLQLKSIAF